MSVPSKGELLEEFVAANEIANSEVLDVFVANACKHDLVYAVCVIGQKLWRMSFDGKLDTPESDQHL